MFAELCLRQAGKVCNPIIQQIEECVFNFPIQNSLKFDVSRIIINEWNIKANDWSLEMVGTRRKPLENQSTVELFMKLGLEKALLFQEMGDLRMWIDMFVLSLSIAIYICS